MILHVYIPHTTHTYGNNHFMHHSGQGLFSVFGRLFSKIAGKTVSKVAAKTALKAAASAGKAVAKKALKTAAKEGLNLAKESLSQGLAEAGNFGAQAALQGIDRLATKAISKGAPAETTHLISSIVKGGAEKAANQIAAKATSKLNAGIDNFASKHNLAGKAAPKRKKEPATTSAGASSSSKNKRRKKKAYNHKSLTTLIDQS